MKNILKKHDISLRLLSLLLSVVVSAARTFPAGSSTHTESTPAAAAASRRLGANECKCFMVWGPFCGR